MGDKRLPPGIPPGTDPRRIVDDGIHPPYVAAAKQPPPPPRPGKPAPTQQPQERQGPGKVGRTVNVGLDIAYVALWGLHTVLCLVGIFASTGTRWPGVAGTALFGYFTYRNINNAIAHAKGAE